MGIPAAGDDTANTYSNWLNDKHQKEQRMDITKELEMKQFVKDNLDINKYQKYIDNDYTATGGVARGGVEHRNNGS